MKAAIACSIVSPSSHIFGDRHWLLGETLDQSWMILWVCIQVANGASVLFAVDPLRKVW